MVFRGLGTGLAWTIAVDGYALASVTDAELSRYMAKRPGSSVAREAVKRLGPLCMRNMLSFAGFLGLYGGLEKVRGKNDLMNPFVGGFTAGLVALWPERRKPRTLSHRLLCVARWRWRCTTLSLPSAKRAITRVSVLPRRGSRVSCNRRESGGGTLSLLMFLITSPGCRDEDKEQKQWTMRQRRHVNGNSNALASTSTVDSPTSSGWGSGRTVPANITSNSKREAPPVVTFDAVGEQTALKTATQGQKSGASTARLPQSSRLASSRDPMAGCRPKRRVQTLVDEKLTILDVKRVHEARAKNITVNFRSSTNHRLLCSLPKLPSQIGDFLNSNNRSSYPQQKPIPPGLSVSASGTDANSQVQWAVKVASTAPAVQATNSPESTEMRDLRRLLRDRYGEKRSVRQAFLTWDTDRNGRLCAEELRDMLTRLGIAQTLGQKKVNTILQHVLARPTASLDYEDFCGFVYGPPEQASSSSSRQATTNARPEEDTISTADPDCVVSLLRAKYESRKVHQVFRDWDIDKNGGVTFAEIESNLRRQGLRIVKPELMKLFDTYDLNRDGRLLYDEFMRLVYGPVHEQRYSYLAEQRRQKSHQQPMHERDPLEFFRSSAVPEHSNHSIDLKEFAARLNDAYAAFDDDHNGYLSYRELCHGLRELGLNLTEHEFLHLATRVDTDGNGEICFKEFCDVFGGGETVNRRPRSARTGDVEDKRVEEQYAHGPQTQIKDGSQRRRAAGTFHFSHLTRRAKTPTRCGRTPYTDTKGIIGGKHEHTTDPARFMTETQLYGSASASRSAKVITTLGQEEKQRYDAAKANRLQRLRVQMERYEDKARPLQDSYNVAQERRVRTLQRHQERYHQRIKEQRPRYALSPARKGIQISRASSQPLSYDAELFKELKEFLITISNAS
ncbi:EF-Hand 1, calcium-binding site [Phytophthora cactorum]|nr:EF-Hand 1, calcium-binding site [Phytophthora cactorum]